MPSESQPDEIILWNDVISLLNERDFAPSLLAMLNTCKVESFDGQRMVVSTSLGFAQRKIEEQAPAIRECLEQAAFQPVDFLVILSNEKHPAVQTVSRMTREELEQNYQGTAEAPLPEKKETSRDKAVLSARQSFFEVDNRGAAESRLTFERFVSGEENEFAFDAAKQVANGVKTSYNPLFIYGKSGVGKTHLLRAIQNYVAINDPSRLCVYRTGSEFIDDYVNAMKSDAAPARVTLLNNYKYVDILIIDDVQNMGRAAGTINFFFETYNTLLSHGKQIVLAADRSPSQLGMGDNKFDEREISRMDSGLTVSIQVPDYELKLKLINNFYERLKSEGAEDHTPGMTGTISEEDRKFMAERSGTNIRIIEGFVQSCLLTASRNQQSGRPFGREDIIGIANTKWPTNQRDFSIEQIQKTVETYYDVSHMDLVGSKRNKELMEPRHVAIWLTRELTDNTLADIGKRFGNRSHATVKHSIMWVEKHANQSRIFQQKVQTIQDSITDNR